MSNEIKLTMKLSVLNGDYNQEVNPGLIQIDQTTQGACGGIVEIGTEEETLEFLDIATEGYLYLRNLDDTNYVTYGPDYAGLVAFGKLKAGEWALLRLAPFEEEGSGSGAPTYGSIALQANTSPCKVKYLLLDN